MEAVTGPRVVGSSVSTFRKVDVFEIDGRLLLQTVNETTQGIPVTGTVCEAIDGDPDVAPGALGEAALRALGQGRVVPHPGLGERPKAKDYAGPLLANSPKRYGSDRSWMRAAGACTRWRLTQRPWWRARIRTSLTTAGGQSRRSSRRATRDVSSFSSVRGGCPGRAVLRALRQPPLRDL